MAALTLGRLSVEKALLLMVMLLTLGCSGDAARKPDRVAGEGEAPEAVARDGAVTLANGAAEGLLAYSFDCVAEAPLSVVVSYRDPDAVWLFLPERTVKLPRVRSASGAKYSDGKTVFWTQGQEARIELSDGQVWACAENRRRSVIEDAKLRGMDFWATGNEPGWTLEIGPDSLVLVTGYGAERHVFPGTEPQVDNDAGIATWQVEAAGHALRAVLTGGGCRDDMSGEAFETAVNVVFDGASLRGCGTALH